MKIRNLAMAAMAVLLPFAAAACSSDSTGDLNKGDVSKELQKGGAMTKVQADCAADALIKADFSKDELKKLNSNDSAKVSAKKVKEFTKAVTGCVSAKG